MSAVSFFPASFLLPGHVIKQLEIHRYHCWVSVLTLGLSTICANIVTLITLVYVCVWQVD